MKVQIHSQSIRFRIDEYELSSLIVGQSIETRTTVGTSMQLSFMLDLTDGEVATVRGSSDAWKVSLPRQAVSSLASRLPSRDGLSFIIPTGDDILYLHFEVDVRDSIRKRGAQHRSKSTNQINRR